MYNKKQNTKKIISLFLFFFIFLSNSISAVNIKKDNSLPDFFESYDSSVDFDSSGDSTPTISLIAHDSTTGRNVEIKNITRTSFYNMSQNEVYSVDIIFKYRVPSHIDLNSFVVDLVADGIDYGTSINAEYKRVGSTRYVTVTYTGVPTTYRNYSFKMYGYDKIQAGTFFSKYKNTPDLIEEFILGTLQYTIREIDGKTLSSKHIATKQILLPNIKSGSLGFGSTLIESSPSSVPSTALKKELNLNGIFAPHSSGYATHHIVAVKDSNTYANLSRKILASYNININSAANGVFLPTSKSSHGAGDATIHTGRHSSKYLKYVYDTLNSAKSRGSTIDQMINTLNSLRQKLLDGSLKL